MSIFLGLIGRIEGHNISDVGSVAGLRPRVAPERNRVATLHNISDVRDLLGFVIRALLGGVG